MENTLDNKEIRGLTVKIVRAFLIAYTTTLLLGAGGWYSLTLQIQHQYDTIDSKNQIQDMGLEALQQQLDQTKIDLRVTNAAVTRQDIELERIKAKLDIK